MIPGLPTELTDRIIDFLWDDAPSLCRCALTCHTWLPRSHYNLYNSIHLDTRRSLESLIRASRIRNVERSLSSVHRLELQDTKPGWVHRLPLVLGHILSDIQELLIEHLDWNGICMHPDTVPFGFMQFGRVTTLSLSGCTFRSPRQFQCLVSALTRLNILKISATVSSAKTAVADTAPAPLRLPPLIEVSMDPNVDQPLVQSLLEWFACASLKPALRKFQLYSSRNVTPQVRKFLEVVGGVLEDLTLFLDQSFSTSDLEQLNVRSCVSLRTLGLRGSRAIALEHMLGVIAPSSRIHDLWLRVNTMESSPNLLSIFEEARFAELQRFTISTFPQEANASVTEAVEALCNRGVCADVSFEYPYVYPRPGGEG
ncbi:hypothetical protein SCP_0705540 [Sparassis crispa]|uniref:F-box domain-containing protein n=1 Tax=Sparassis crispa TaxID=139825 RepID=A0A401GT30_9APHY|nr:hypothetical protein SCP_0705540 [Sparassis crispa]GBE85367.1 hypothetical protein SCP_0705540 [Sparassis crispa]